VPGSRDGRLSGLKLFTALSQHMAAVGTPATPRQTSRIIAKSNVLNTLHVTYLLS
jgi:hypothetical protein